MLKVRRVRKKRSWNVFLRCDSCTWTLYDSWRFDLSARPTRNTVASINMYHDWRKIGSTSVHCNSCYWTFMAFGMKIRSCTMLLTSVCDVVYMTFFLYSLSFESFTIRWLWHPDLSLNMNGSIFSFPSWSNHSHKVATSLNRSVWLVWWLWKASLRPSFCPAFWPLLRFLQNQGRGPQLILN